MAHKHEWETDRLLIRRFREEDAAGLEELHSDAETCRFLGGIWPDGRARQILPLIISNYQTKDMEWFAVSRKEDDALLGACWLAPLGQKWLEPLGIDPEIEIGYRYIRRYWGNGYATEAGRAMLRRGFEEMNLPQIGSIVNQENIASDRVLIKLGMQFRKAVDAHGITVKYYTLGREDFRANQLA
jgi:RimJ/RimL family protein N-acetyltransferase